MIDVQKIKEKFPKGTEVILIHMGEDLHPIPDFTRGTVRFVDDMGTIHTHFTNGRRFGIVPGTDKFAKVMSFYELKDILCAANAAKKEMAGFICIDNSSFDREYPAESRIYEVSSSEKAFTAGVVSNSIHGYSLDRTDMGVRLDIYMHEGWKAEYCYVEEDF